MLSYCTTSNTPGNLDALPARCASSLEIMHRLAPQESVHTNLFFTDILPSFMDFLRFLARAPFDAAGAFDHLEHAVACLHFIYQGTLFAQDRYWLTHAVDQGLLRRIADLLPWLQWACQWPAG